MNLDKVLIILGGEPDKNFVLGAANIKHVNTLPAIGANVLDILKHDVLILNQAAVQELEERLS